MEERPIGTEPGRPRRDAVLFLGLAFLVLALWAWERDLFDADEGRYASVAAGMADSGDWVTPRLNGMRFMDKPPLVYWVQALLFEVFGRSALAARAPTLLAGAFWALFVFLFARAWGGSRRAAWLAGLLAVTSAAGMIGSRVGPQMDMPLAAAVTGVLYAGWRGIVRPGPRPALGLGLAAGLGLLIKGPLAVGVPGLVALAWGLGGVAPGRILRIVFSPWAWIVAVLVAAPWYVLVERANPGWIAHFITYEHFGRFATGDHRAFHPFWFYVPIALIYMAPWTPLAWGGRAGFDRGGRWGRLLLAFLVCSPWSPRPWNAAVQRTHAVGREAQRDLPSGRIAWLWFLAAFLLYSVSTRKLLNYLLPAAAPLFVLLGWLLDRRLRDGRGAPWILPLLCGGAGVAGGLLLLGGLWFPFATGRLPSSLEAPRYASLGGFVLAGGLIVVAGALLGWRLRAQQAAVGALVLAVALGWWLLDLGLARVAHIGSARELATAIRRAGGPGDLLVSLKRYPQGLGFYRAPPMWIAGGTPDAPGQREIVNPYARDAWMPVVSLREARVAGRPSRRGGLLAGDDFERLWSGGASGDREPGIRVLLICRWAEIAPLGAHIVAGPFGGAGRTDLYLVTNRPPPP